MIQAQYKMLTNHDNALLNALAKNLKEKHSDPERKLHDYHLIEETMKKLKTEMAERTAEHYKELAKGR